jgi:dihydroxyacetone kinase-like predicted kinase
MSAVVTQAKKTVKKTPDLLPQLKEAGVVDAGGKGLFYVFQGMNNYINERIAKSKALVANAMKPETESVPQGYGFDLQFLLRGNGMPLDMVRSKIEKMGESVIVVGDECLIRVHVHTHKPGAVLKYVRTIGEVTDVLKESLDEQIKEFRKKHGQLANVNP